MAHSFDIQIDRATLEAKRKLAEGSGFKLVGDHGTAPPYNDVVIGYDYNETVGVLTITVKDKPFFAPESLVESKIREFFA